MKLIYKFLFFSTVFLSVIINISFVMAEKTDSNEKNLLTSGSSINTNNVDNGEVSLTSGSSININNEKDTDDKSFSNWAADEVNEAKNLGIIPKELCSKYTEAITRKDFCKLIVNTLAVQNSKIIESADISNVNYTDCDDVTVKQASALGIVSGVGNNKFNPNGKITRQEAARMLYTAATISQRNPDFEEYFDWKFVENNKYLDFPYIFADTNKIDYWAAIGVQYCFQNEIMFGVGRNEIGKNVFNSLGTYSREQAYATALRLYKKFNGEGIECEIIRDDETGLYGYKSDSFSLPCKYEKAYRFKDGKAVVSENSVYKLIDSKGNVLLNDIVSSVGLFSNEYEYVYDCYGDYIMVVAAKFRRVGEPGIDYDGSIIVYDCTKAKSIWRIDKIRFTRNGDIIRFDEKENNANVAAFDLFSRKNGDYEHTDEIQIYRK